MTRRQKRVIKGPPRRLPREADRDCYYMEVAVRRNPAAVRRLEGLPAFRTLVDAGFSAGMLALFCLDCLDWNRLDTLRPLRKHVVVAHRHLAAALTALKELGDLEPVLSAWQVAIGLGRFETERKRLTPAALRELPAMIASYITELELILGKLAVRRGKPRKFSRELFLKDFRKLVPKGVRRRRSFERQAAALYAALFDEPIDPEVYVRRRRRAR